MSQQCTTSTWASPVTRNYLASIVNSHLPWPEWSKTSVFHKVSQGDGGIYCRDKERETGLKLCNEP